ncbi:zinc-binding dehydrogenase [candidate division KSB1 bacterium]|nr:zinc-binding dehydrogenase [candidate division KSB1 bacterium]
MRVICALSTEKPKDLEHIKEPVEAGYIQSTIDKTFTLEQAAQAHVYVEEGQKKGHVVIKMND